MAGLTSLREVPAHVIRIGRTLKILQVARDARGASQRVVAICVAVGALSRRDGMHAGQGKASRGMVELSIGPLHCVVAQFAGCRKSGVRNRRRRAGEIFLVARVAGAAA